MQITVKSAKILKSGTNKSGEWELVGVTSDDGTNYATFHKNAKNLTTGTVIDIGEPEIKEGKISFKEYKVVSAPATPAPSNGKPESRPGMTPELWAEKDRVQRLSIETQTAFKGIMEVAKACIEKETNTSAMVKFAPVYEAALDWAMEHFQPTQKPSQPVKRGEFAEKEGGNKTPPEATKSKSTSSAPVTGSQLFANPGEFYSACLKEFKIQKSQTDKEITGFNLTTEEGRKQAWEQIVEVYGVKDEEKPVEKKDAAQGQTSLDPDNIFE